MNPDLQRFVDSPDVKLPSLPTFFYEHLSIKSDFFTVVPL